MAGNDELLGVIIFDEKVDPSKRPTRGKLFAIYATGIPSARQEYINGAGQVIFQDKNTYVLPAGPDNVNYKEMKKHDWVVILSEPTDKVISEVALKEYKEKAKNKSSADLKALREKADKKHREVKEKTKTAPKGRKK